MITLKTILKIFSNEIEPYNCTLDETIEGIVSLDEISENKLSYCKYNDDRILSLIPHKKGFILLHLDQKKNLEHFKTTKLLFTLNPRLTFIKIANYFFPPPQKKGIASSAIIGKNSLLGHNIYIGEYVTIGDNVVIGENTIIHNGCCIYDNTQIGSNCIIYSGVIIGSDGFGYERDIDGTIIKFPHYGNVIIEDNVEIGANTCIDRGTLNNTIIGEGTKIDNLCHIAHNVHIGKHSYVIAQSLIGGSTLIGERVWIAPCSCIKNGLKIGNDSLIGMGSVVTKDVAENKVVVGVPAKILRENIQ